jgi:hypothetical protein
MRYRLSITGVALAAAAALAVAAAPASAATYHTTESYLHFPARTSDAISIPYRTLVLRGQYYWYSSSRHWSNQYEGPSADRIVRLQGRYRWYDYLRRVGDRYQHVSIFVNARTSGRVTLTHWIGNRFGDGKYEWGSQITNTRDHSTHPS